MLKKGLWGLSAVFYLWVAVAGFGYFGTGSTARNLRATFFYQTLVGAPLSSVLGQDSSGGTEAGRIVRIIKPGEIKYKPSDSFVFYPADENQIFTGRTVVSTGLGSEIVIALTGDSYELELKQNSTVVIDGAPPMDEGEEVVSSLKVEIVSGDVSAKAMKQGSGEPQPKLQIIDVEDGTSTELGGDVDQRVEQEEFAPPVSDDDLESVPSLDPPSTSTPPASNSIPAPKADTPVSATKPTPPAPSEGLPFEESKEGFTKTVEKSIDEVFQTELRRVNCGTLLDLRSEVMLTYRENERLRDFLRKWAAQIRKHGCR